MVVLLSKTGLELIGWEVVPCRGKPWGRYWQLLLCVRCERRHHNLNTYCLFPHYLWHFLVEMLDSCVMNDLCHGFLNPNFVYIFSSAYFGFISSSFFKFLKVCLYRLTCGPQTCLFLTNPVLSDVLCLNIAHLLSPFGHSVSITLLAFTLRPDGR